MTEPAQLGRDVVRITNIETTSQGSFERGFCKQVQDGGEWRLFGHWENTKLGLFWDENTRRFLSRRRYSTRALRFRKTFSRTGNQNINKTPKSGSAIFDFCYFYMILHTKWIASSNIKNTFSVNKCFWKPVSSKTVDIKLNSSVNAVRDLVLGNTRLWIIYLSNHYWLQTTFVILRHLELKLTISIVDVQ